MHFWIDKRSQGCGFNVRRQVPPSLSGYGRNPRILCGSFYPKPMVTPIHRFQSIESVTNNGLRHTRSPGYHARTQTQTSLPPAVHYNGSSSNIRMPQVGRSMEIIAPGHTPTRRFNYSRFKCVVWIFFAVVTLLTAGAKYYFRGINGFEALVFSSLFVIVLIIVGMISLCDYSPSNNPIEAPNVQLAEQPEIEDSHIQVQTTALPQNSSEMPPPPYHIAVMLSPQNDLDSIEVIRDSPPPSYEKAVT